MNTSQEDERVWCDLIVLSPESQTLPLKPPVTTSFVHRVNVSMTRGCFWKHLSLSPRQLN